MVKPLVSICIPTYNHANIIGDAIFSALSQDYENLEILVQDNASTDVTREIVSNIAKNDARVRYVRNSENLGMVGNFNACLAASRGELIKFLCADDLLVPDCVSKMVDALVRNPATALVASARQIVDNNLRPLRIAGFSRSSLQLNGAAVIRDCFYRGNLIGEPTAVMFRRQQGMRGFCEEYPQLMDLEMWMYLLRSGGMTYIDQPLCKVRLHPQQATQQHLKSGIVLADKRRLFREFHGEISPATIVNKLSWDLRMAITLLRMKDAGATGVPPDIEEIYYRPVFGWLTRPAAWLLWVLAGIKRGLH